MTRRKVLNKILFYIGVIILIIPPIFVFAWMILTALKSGVQNIEYPPLFIFKPTLENFKAVFQQHNFFQYLINSTIIAVTATIISLLVGLPAAYSIVRYNQKKLSMAILIARMTPFISYLLPWYIVFRMLGLIDTFIGMIMTHLIITLPMVIWLMIAFFENVPQELEESAFIDGCTLLLQQLYCSNYIFYFFLESISILTDFVRSKNSNCTGGSI